MGAAAEREVDRVRQARRALEVANARRCARPAIRQRLRRLDYADGSHLVGEMISNRAPAVAGMLAWQALQMLPGVGPVAAASMCQRAGVSSWCLVRRLTDRQAAALADGLERCAAGRCRASRKRGVSSAKASGVLACVRCDNPLIGPSADGLCGFCQAETLPGLLDEAAGRASRDEALR
ncbi:MAG: hypothetical protein ACRDVE_03090 [Actinocrinis sp.]